MVETDDYNKYKELWNTVLKTECANRIAKSRINSISFTEQEIENSINLDLELLYKLSLDIYETMNVSLSVKGFAKGSIKKSK